MQPSDEPWQTKERVASLTSQTGREAVADELEALRSIYGDGAVAVWPGRHPNDDTIRYEVLLNLTSPYEEISFRVLVSLPPTYPASSPPQLQLLSKYIGDFGVDPGLFGAFLRTFMTSIDGVEWTPDGVCIFDGLQNVQERCSTWYENQRRMRINAERGVAADQNDKAVVTTVQSSKFVSDDALDVWGEQSSVIPPAPRPEGTHITVAEAITDRKEPISWSCMETLEGDVLPYPQTKVPTILEYLMSDKCISRAAHPIINAWRCQVGALVHQDNDDNGETAAGGRLAHLLQILDVSDVLVVVTRYFGGIHLGPDRFKHINQAARNALELGGFLDLEVKSTARAKKRR